MTFGPNQHKRGTSLICPACGQRKLTANLYVNTASDPRGICGACKTEFGTTHEAWVVIWNDPALRVK
jgi:uncharacterized protein (DUF983 family)